MLRSLPILIYYLSAQQKGIFLSYLPTDVLIQSKLREVTYCFCVGVPHPSSMIPESPCDSVLRSNSEGDVESPIPTTLYAVSEHDALGFSFVLWAGTTEVSPHL